MRSRAKYLLSALAAVVIAVAAAAAAAFVIATYGILPSSVTRLSPIGRSCNTCHSEEGSYNATFNEPYPHYVRSVRWKTGLSKITAEGMVQFCMVSAMEGKPL